MASTFISPAQLAANRANALHSTGPRSLDGKLASSQNANTHGLTARHACLPFEDPAEYAAHHQNYFDAYRPASPLDQELVIELADLRWRLRRVPAFEAQVISAECERMRNDEDLQQSVADLDELQLATRAFVNLIESKVITNLVQQEARLARRADRIHRQLLDRKMEPISIATAPAQPPMKPAPEPAPEIRKNEPIRVAPQPGRNDRCPCKSGLKYKHCCLDRRPTELLRASSQE